MNKSQEPRAKNQEDGKRKIEVLENVETTNKSQTSLKTKDQKPKTIRRSHSALSIKSLTDKRISTKKKATIDLDVSNLPNNSFTTAQIQELWKTAIDSNNKKGEKLLASLMSSCTPIAKGDKLTIELPSKLMKVDLEKSKPKILPFLRDELQNYKIDFDIIVNEEVVKKFAYTPQEKYAYLLDKNSAISILKQKFHLDF